MKKVLFIILSLVLVLTLAVGCSSNEKGNGDVSDKDSAVGEEIKIKLGHAAAESTTLHWSWMKVKEIVAEKSDGRIKIDIFPASQLGNERELIEATQLGNLTMCSTSTAPVAGFQSNFFAFDLPFVYNDRQKIYDMLDGEIGKSILDSLEEANIKGLGFWENGFRHITTTSKPVRTLEDMKGLKFRTMENEVHMEAFNLLGASPVPMAWGEVYTALTQKTVDGQETPIELIHNTKLHEVQGYLTKTGHLYGPYALMINKDFFNDLTAEDQKIIQDAIDEVTPLARARAAEKEKELEVDMATILEIIELSPEELERFKEEMEPAFALVRAKIGEDLVSKILEANK